MNYKPWITSSIAIAGTLILAACQPVESPHENTAAPARQGIEVKFLAGSALKDFCNQAAQQLDQQNPTLENGQAFYLTCDARGSGDVVTAVTTLAEQLKAGTLQPDAPEFPSLISVDGEIYHSQLLYRMNQIYPGQDYIPGITDAPLLAYSPMVFMAPADVAPGLRKQPDVYQALVTAQTHQDLDPSSPLLPIHFVQTAPTRSNSGLQTLVTQFASVSNKRPEQLTVADVEEYQPQVQQIQSKVTRYGASTNSLAEDMIKNGPFWASVGSVYESSVIKANSQSQAQPQQTRYEAIYPLSTFTSNMRGILPNAPWINEDEKQATAKVLEYLRSPEIQKIATDLGLRPGVPGIPLGDKFSAQFGVDAKAKYDSLRPPQPEVVDAMLQSWENFAKKPSQVVIVVDSSGSMRGEKLPAVQNTLRFYLESLGPKETLALIDFDSEIQQPVLISGTPEGRDRGMQFITSLNAGGGTRLYDATLFAQNWLQQNSKSDAINAVIVLTDGADSESVNSLEQVEQELQKTGFNTDQRIAVFTVGYGQEGEFEPEVLKKLPVSMVDTIVKAIQIRLPI